RPAADDRAIRFPAAAPRRALPPAPRHIAGTLGARRTAPHSAYANASGRDRLPHPTGHSAAASHTTFARRQTLAGPYNLAPIDGARRENAFANVHARDCTNRDRIHRASHRHTI